MDGNRLLDLFLQHSEAARMLDKEEGDVAAKLCEIAKEFLKERAKAFLCGMLTGGLFCIPIRAIAHPRLPNPRLSPSARWEVLLSERLADPWTC